MNFPSRKIYVDPDIMIGLKLTQVVVAVILVLHASNVRGINMNNLKKVFKSFFNSLERIIGTEEEIAEIAEIENARTTYNGCAEQASTYEDLVTCGQTAYAVYHTYLGIELADDRKAILNLRSSFLSAIMKVTVGESKEKRKIPFQGFVTLANSAATKQALAASDRQERW